MVQIKRKRRTHTGSRTLTDFMLSVSLIVSLAFLTWQYKSLFKDCIGSTVLYVTSESKKNVEANNNNDATTTALVMEPLDCQEITMKIKKESTGMDPFEANEIRRRMALTDEKCFKKHLQFFVNAFKKRAALNKNYHLLVPESVDNNNEFMCEMSLKRNKNKCKYRDLCADWSYACRDEDASSAPSCKALRMDAVVKNERWLDYEDALFCPDRLYSISIREPVSRAMEHVDTWFKNHHKEIYMDEERRASRLNVIQSNYMTWSLLSGKYSKQDPYEYQVTQNDLDVAKQVLSRFDVVLDMNENHCLSESFKFLGMARVVGTIPRTKQLQEVSVDDEYSEDSGNETDDELSYSDMYWTFYNREVYGMINAVDSQLYEYALELMRVDCEFFEHVIKL